MADEEREPRELRGDAGDVVAGTVVIRQGGARSVRAREVMVRQGGAGRVEADTVSVTQGGIGVAACRGELVLQQGSAAVVAAQSAQISDSAVGVLLARQVNAQNVRVLLGTREALAFGAAAGVVLWLLRRWGGRR